MTTQLNQLTELTTTSDGDLLLIRESATGVDKKMQAQNLRAKATTKADVGLGNVTNDAQLKIASNLSDLNDASTARTNIGLGNVDNVSAADLRDRSTHTGTQALSTISDAGTIASQDANSVNIDGGNIDGTAIGASSASSGAFTTLTASGDVNFDSGTLFVDASADRVGVNTLIPTAALDVRGEGAFYADAITLRESNSTRAYTFVSKDQGKSMIGGNIRLDDTVTTGTHIGYASGTHLRGGAGIIFENNATNYGVIEFVQKNDTDDDTWVVREAMRIDSSGNVGIDVTNPARKLHVSDTMRLEPRATAPSSPAKGDIYFDSSDDKLKCYDGTAWQNLY